MIRYTPIARPEVEAGAGAGTEAVRTVAEDDEALRHLMVGVGAEARVEHERSQRRRRLLVSLVWLLMKQQSDATVRRPRRKLNDDARMIQPTPLAPTAPMIAPRHPLPILTTLVSSLNQTTSPLPLLLQ